jgi:hypothetical protein
MGNRAAFDQAINAALGTLNSTIDTIIANLPSAASLAQTIQGELLGTAPNTLQSMLAAIPTPGSSRFGAARFFRSQGSLFISQTAATVTFQVRTSPAPTGSISQSTIQQDLGQVQSAFQSFSQTYFNDVSTILLPAGTTNPSANRAAFDQAIGTALGTLNASIASALSNLPAALTATLNTTVQNDLLSSATNASNNLQSRLAALQTPAGAQGVAPSAFRFGSSLTISSAQNQVTHDILVAINQYNASFTG